mgnify:CR=1 FL=1
MMQSRTHNCGELRAQHAGEHVKLVGWMENVREVGGSLAFVVLRDFYGTTQIVVDSAEMMKTVKGINKESTIAVTGTVRLRESPNSKLATGEIYVLFHKVVDAEAAAKMVAERPTLPPNSKRATLVQPLSACTRHPEVIVFTGTPEQMMWLSMSMSYFDGHRHDFHASGFNAQCVEATLLPLMNEEPNISFGCYGGRASSDIGEDMMYMGVPANRLDTIVEGCQELAKRAIPQSRMKIYVPPIM